MKVTNQIIEMSFMGMDLVIPKGTRVTNQTANGIDDDYNFIDDFSWHKPELTGFARSMELHDMTYRGINIPKDKIEVV